MYYLYTAVLGFGILRRPTDHIRVVVCAVLPSTHEKSIIFVVDQF